MKTKLLQIVLFSIFAFTNLYSQSTGSLRGIVMDSSSSEPLAFTNVYVKELSRGTTTDDKGLFILTSIPQGDYKINISYVGYEKKEIRAKVLSGKLTHIEIKLSKNSIEMQTVEAIGEKVAESNATDLGLQKILIKDLEKMPQGVELDIFRSLQYIPGVKATGDISAKYYVRGSPSNQNLVLINNIPIYHPFHALGMFSAIDPEMINNIEFYKGGYTSEYTGALASVMKLVTKNGNLNNFSGKAQASLLTGKASLEGPILGGSFMLTGRKSYNKEILKKFSNGKDIPINFYDYSINMNFPNVYENSSIKLFGFVSNDKIDNRDFNEADYNWSNKLIGLTWFYLSDSPLFFELGVYYSQFEGNVTPNLSTVKPMENFISDVSLDANFRYVYDSKNELNIGLKIQEIRSELFFQNTSGIKNDISEPKGTNIDIYGKYKILSNENIGIDLGTRFNLTRLSGNSEAQFLEPRISTTFRLFPQLALKASWGIYSQELSTLSDEDELISIFEPWFITPSNLPPAKAIHYAAGIDLSISNELKTEMAIFYKDLVSFSAINDNKISSHDSELVEAKGKSYGFESRIEFNPFPFNTSLGYSLSKAEKEANGLKYPPRYDIKHSVNFSISYDFGKGWLSSITWNYSSGLPFTQIKGFRDEWNLQDLENTNNYSDELYPYTIFGNRNAARLPDYHRLDFNLSKNVDLDYIKLYFTFNIINIYDRKNIFYYKKDTGERVNMLPFLPTASIKVEL